MKSTVHTRSPIPLSLGAALVAVLVAAVAASAQAPVPALSLSDAVDRALQSHPDARGPRLGVALGEAGVAEARASRWPVVDVSETVTRGNNPVFVFGSLLEQARFGPANLQLDALNNPQSITNMRTTLAARLPVFDGGRTLARIATTEAALSQAERGAAAASDAVRFEIVGKYFGVLVASERERVAADAVRMAEAEVERATAFVDAGTGVLSDLLGARVELAGYRQQQVEAAGGLDAAFAALNVAIGLPLVARPELTDPLRVRDFPLAPVDVLVVRALEGRADLGAAESGIDAARARLSGQRGESLPEVRVFSSLDASSRDPFTGSADYTIGASIRFTLFDAGRASREDQARLRIEAARVERDRVRDRIQVEVYAAHARFRATAERLRQALAARELAAEALRIVEDRYEVGLATMNDVLRAGTSRVDAERNVAESVYGTYVDYASLMLASGQLGNVAMFRAPSGLSDEGGTP